MNPENYVSLLIVILFLVLPSLKSWALTPDEVLVVANRNASGSVGLAQYYMEKRGILEDNLLKLRVTDKEHCTREEYDQEIAAPIQKYLKERDPQKPVRCLLMMYGLPLKVASPELTPQERKEVEGLQKKLDAIQSQIKNMGKEDEERRVLEKESESLKKQIASLQKPDQASSLDSEVALVLDESYPLAGWIPNPLFPPFRGKQLSHIPRNVLMVSRLDGPSEKIVRRIIDESLTAEENGLSGKAYFDARSPDPGDKTVSGYSFYDRSILRAANRIKEENLMPVVVETTQELFQPGDCPDTALYCGWYKLAHYVDAFAWRPGSIGYHIASQECQTLKQPGSQAWCKMMLEKGVAVTLGPVEEPYLQSFPVPEFFFGLLIRGELTLAECYALSNPSWSWKMVLIGDPLYRPFKNKPASVNPVRISHRAF